MSGTSVPTSAGLLLPPRRRRGHVRRRASLRRPVDVPDSTAATLGGSLLRREPQRVAPDGAPK